MSDDIRFEWNAVDWNGDVGHYDVYRKPDGGSWSKVATVSSGTTHYDSYGLRDGERYAFYVDAVNSVGSNSSNSDKKTTSLPSPTGVSATVDANDQITVSWNDVIDYGNYRIQIQRDGGNWVNPSGGSTTVGNNTTSATYGPNSDNSYESQVGIDSSFRFRVRTETEHKGSSYQYTSTVYTDPIPPHNPSVSRPDANTIDISWENQSDSATIDAEVSMREDTGSGYGSWKKLDNYYGTSASLNVGDSSAYNNLEISEDARYQIRLRTFNTDASSTLSSEYVYADYGNNGNVYFEDDFESNDLSKWRRTPNAYVSSGSGMDSGFSGADQGTYYAILDGDSKIDVNLGELSNESDVIVKAAVAVGSADSSGEELAIDFWDGDNWQQLTDYHWEYNKQGWVEMNALVPDSYLNNDDYIRFESESGGNGEHYYIDRVVVSDILHEYTEPSAPSGLSLDTSVEDEITSSWTENATFDDIGNGGKVHAHYTIKLHLDGSEIRDDWPTLPTTSYTHSSLNDGEEYEVRLNTLYEQMRHGSENNTWYSSEINVFGTTILPSPSGTSISPASSTSLDVTWTDNTDNEDGTKVYYRETGASSWNLFSDLSSNTTSETVTGLSQDTEYESYVSTYTEHVSADSASSTATTYFDEVRSINSHVGTISDDVNAVISVTTFPSSHAGNVTSSSMRTITLNRLVDSHTGKMGNSVSRNFISFNRDSDSHSNPILSFVYTEKTSLELLDYDVEWHSDKAVWVTPWRQESRVLGSEDTLALKNVILDDAKNPAANITIQYDKNGNGIVNQESDTIRLRKDEEVREVTGLPVNETGFYRIKIDNYSGYNSLISLDLAIVH